MTKMQLLDKLGALEQLHQEKIDTCRMYKSCNSCPNFLVGDYCEIKLAIKALQQEIIKMDKKK